MDCSQALQRTAFICPRGDHFHFLLGFPEKEQRNHSFEGKLKLFYKNQKIYETSFESQELLEVSWLQLDGHSSYLLTANKTQAVGLVNLDSYLELDKEYEVEITFDGDVPENCSLWLSYLESLKKNLKW